MDASESLSCENNNSSLFSAVPDSSNMYQNKDSNLISDLREMLSGGVEARNPKAAGWLEK